MSQSPPPDTARQAWLGLLAKAPAGAIKARLSDSGIDEAFEWLRAPEIGSVMVRGRTGATGAPFNLGEMTVTRGTLRLASGAVGHGVVQGRRKPDCEAAAMVDALMQTPAAPTIREKILAPLEAQADATRQTRARKAAATKVEFFTLVRGED